MTSRLPFCASFHRIARSSLSSPGMTPPVYCSILFLVSAYCPYSALACSFNFSWNCWYGLVPKISRNMIPRSSVLPERSLEKLPWASMAICENCSRLRPSSVSISWVTALSPVITRPSGMFSSASGFSFVSPSPLCFARMYSGLRRTEYSIPL